jgi:DNA-binding transcriptional LysR family regulator
MDGPSLSDMGQSVPAIVDDLDSPDGQSLLSMKVLSPRSYCRKRSPMPGFSEVRMSAEHLEFRLLKYIVAIADAGSFTAAAARLHLAQSSLSTQVGQLEDVLGIRIFDRQRGLALTAEGKVLIRYAREGLKIRERIVRTVQAIHAGKVMPLRLGFTPFVENTLLKSVTDLYRELLPESKFIPETGDTDELTNRIRQDSLDAAIVTLPIMDDELETSLIERERLVICMRGDDPLAASDAIPPDALDGRVSIFNFQRHHPTAYARLVEMFEGLGVRLRPAKPTLNIDHIQWMVKEGVCYSLIRANQSLMNGLVTRSIAGVDWTIDTAFATKAEHENPVLSWFVEELTKHFKATPTMPAKKPVAAVRGYAAEQGSTSRAHENQLALFTGLNEAEDDHNRRKLSPHRKQVLDK